MPDEPLLMWVKVADADALRKVRDNLEAELALPHSKVGAKPRLREMLTVIQAEIDAR